MLVCYPVGVCVCVLVCLRVCVPVCWCVCVFVCLSMKLGSPGMFKRQCSLTSTRNMARGFVFAMHCNTAFM